MVSTRVVKTRMGVPVPSRWKSISAPSERPIQLRCMVSTRSGQPPSSSPHGVEQFVGVSGDSEEPLFEGALLHGRGFVTPAAAVHHLLVGEHGGAFGAPVDQRLFAIGQAALQHLEEEPLVPAIIFGIAGGDFAVPIVAEAEAAMRSLHVRDLSLVHSRGRRLLAMAAFSAGSPNASQPMGCSTLKPRIHL